jgi:phosphotransferase system IIB component
MFSGMVFGLYFEKDNIAQLEECAAKLEVTTKNERSSQ